MAVGDGLHAREEVDEGHGQANLTGEDLTENAASPVVDTGDSVGAAMVEPAEENSRPKRVRKQNVRYSPEEYDLSVVSVSGLGQGGNPKKLKQLSGRRGKSRKVVKIWSDESST